MAGVNVESGNSGRKSVNAEINMIPMIDLLMVTIAFLLVTAVWSQMSRVEANANVPGDPKSDPVEQATPKRLHVREKEAGRYELSWKTGKENGPTILVEETTRRGAALPALAAAIADAWKREGVHRDAGDLALDEAVVHTQNDVPYSELVAILDAVKEPTRNVALGGQSKPTSAFAVTFSVD